MKIYFSKISILSMIFWCTFSFAQVKQIALPNIKSPFKSKNQSSKTIQKKVIVPAVSIVDTTTNSNGKWLFYVGFQ